ncbi:UNVERIFIED_CONTAM: hypothetical protein GTU68_052083 [Idotea baltica]|nr:hypothetical protein [Idotea baltica]
MNERIEINGLQVAKGLFDFVNNEALPGTTINAESFWQDFANIINELSKPNQLLLDRRNKLQADIDCWHQTFPGPISNPKIYKEFLEKIGYLEPIPSDFKIQTKKIDEEISMIPGPQLVVPAMNARFILNAVNARWGSLYDALYGTDVIAESTSSSKKKYNPVRGAEVIAYARQFLDSALPLQAGSHLEAKKYYISEEKELVVVLADDSITTLKSPLNLIACRGTLADPKALLFKHNNLHIEIQIDPDSSVGSSDLAGINDVILESAPTAIIDFEDSVSAVDADDKVLAYRNWLGLMQGNLTKTITKDGKSFVRSMNENRKYTQLNGQELELSGRSLLLVRNVGHLMTSDAILNKDGCEVFEGILDGVLTSLIAMHDLKRNTFKANSCEGSIYIVKPKMHGSEEVAFTCILFERIESLLGLEKNTIKMGIMDEERRTTLNLKACIKEAIDRVAFINTGFFDRTGDEIHTSMDAGPIVRKSTMKTVVWIAAYEDQNVDVGLATGFSGKAQIGKGMWPMPDLMAAMVKKKINHPLSGANTAWVPSPTAATLHALHYHHIDVFQQQLELINRPTACMMDLLTVPVDPLAPNWPEENIQNELDNNIQGILGYVVRWINQGIGCSKVLDINNIACMEDRATLRISSQLLANWLRHNIITKEQVIESLARMALLVDSQNSQNLGYLPLANNSNENIAFLAAKELILDGRTQPNGYTDMVLYQRRKDFKAAVSSHN